VLSRTQQTIRVRALTSLNFLICLLSSRVSPLLFFYPAEDYRQSNQYSRISLSTVIAYIHTYVPVQDIIRIYPPAMSTINPEIYTHYPSLKKFEDEDAVESHDGWEVALLKYIYDHPDLDTKLRNSPSAILDVMDEFAVQHDFLINIGPAKGKIIMTALIAEYKPKVLVELGEYVGYSAIWFAREMLAAATTGEESFAGFQLYSLEFDPLLASIAMNLIDLAGLSDIVKVVVGPAAHSLRRLHAEGVLTKIDMLFLGHIEDLYERDLKVCEELGLLDRQGSLVVADNFSRPGAPQYREYVRQNPRYESWGIRGLIITGEIEV
jgi:catechol O-methyltransferase